MHYRREVLPLTASRRRVWLLILISLYSGALYAQSSFVDVLSAELALRRGHTEQALDLYRSQALITDQAALLDRALAITLDANQLESGLEIAQHWVRVDPNHIPALFYLSHLALRLHQYPLAAQTLDRVLRYDPDAALDRILVGIYPDSSADRLALLNALNQLDSRNNPSLLVLTAGLLAQNGQSDEALQKVDRALRKRPNVTAFITLRVNILLQQNKQQLVDTWLAQQVSRQPNNKSLRLFQVRQLLNQQQQAQALTRLDRMVKRWPQDGEIILLAALVSIDQQRHQDAERYLAQLLPQDAYLEQAYYYLGINAERMNQLKAAEVYFKNVQSEELYPKAQKKIALLRANHGRLDDALTGLTQERVDHPEHASFLYLLQAQLLRENGQTARARQLLDEALSNDNNQAELIYSRVLLMDNSEQDLMERELERLLALQPNNATYLNAYAFALADQNRRLNDARILAERANTLMPEQAPILDTLGYIALRQQQWPNAREYLQKAYQFDPSLTIGLRLADALQKNQQHDAYLHLMKELQQRHAGDPRLNPVQPLPTEPRVVAYPKANKTTTAFKISRGHMLGQTAQGAPQRYISSWI